MASSSRTLLIVYLMVTPQWILGESCAITNTVTSQNNADFGALLPDYPGRYAADQEGLDMLFHYLYSNDEIDLIIIMDRSRDTDRSYFYLRQKKLVRDLLWYYANLSSGKTRVAIITFATESTLIYNGLLPDSQLSRDDMFRPGGPWDRVTYQADPTASHGSNIQQAFQMAGELFSSSPRYHQVRRFLVTVSAGGHEGHPAAGKAVLQELGLTMFSVSSGMHQNNANVMELASSEEYFGDDVTWLDRLWHMRPGRGLTHECYVDKCQNGGWCVVTEQDGYVCRCLWGYKGYRCELEENECEPEACEATGYCIDGQAAYTCGCFDDSCGCYCGDLEVDGVCPTGTWVTWWSITLVLIGSICVLLIIAVITLLIILTYRNRQAKKHGQSSAINRPNNIRELYQVIRFGHDNQGYTSSDEKDGPDPDDGGAQQSGDAADGGSSVDGVTPNGDVYSMPHANRSPVPKNRILSSVSTQSDVYTDSPVLPTKRRTSVLANAISVACEIARRPRRPSTVRQTIGKGPVAKKRSPISRDDIMHPTMATNNDIYKDIIDNKNFPKNKSDVSKLHALDSTENTTPASSNAIDALSKHMAKAAPSKRPIAAIKPVLKDIIRVKGALKCPVPPAELCSSGYGCLDDLSVCYSEFTEYSEDEYEDVCEQRNMESWLTYISDVIRREGLENLCVIHRIDKQWVTSHRVFLPSKEELCTIINVLDSGLKGDKFTFKSKVYVVEDVDDQEFCAVQSEGMALLCGISTDSYVVLASHVGSADSFKMLCKANIKYIQQHL